MRLVCIALFFPIFALGDTPQPLTLSIRSPIDSFLEVSPYTWMYGDPTRVLHLAEVQALWEGGAFAPCDQFQWPSYFIRGKKAWWVRATIKNEYSDTLEAALKVFNGDSIALYDGSAPARHCGWAYCPDEWQGALPFPAKQTFYLRWGPGETKTLYFRVASHLGFTSGIRIDLIAFDWYSDQWLARKMPYFIVSGILVGFIGFILIFALLQLVQTRDKTYGFYAGYLLAFLLLQLRGLSPEFWDADNPFYWKAYFSYILIVWLLYGSYILFLDAFSDARQTAPALHRFLRGFFAGVMGLYALAAGVYWIDIYWGWYLTLFTKVLCQLAGLGFLVVFWRQPSPLYRYLAWGMGALALFALLAIALDFTPVEPALRARGLSTDLVGYVGVIIELVFFTMGLAYKSRLAIAEREQARTENRQLQLERVLEAERLRTRIAQDIHDEVGGSLTKISLTAQLVARLPELSAAELKSRLEKLGADARYAAGQLREIVFAINPDFDSFEEMQAYFQENAREFWSDTSVAPHFDFGKTGHNPVVSPDLKRQLLLIFKEAQHNVAKHAGASNVWLSFKMPAPDRYLLEVKDDGRGFDTAQKNSFTHGLSGMKKRAESIGAALSIHSAPGEGAVVRVEGGF